MTHSEIKNTNSTNLLVLFTTLLLSSLIINPAHSDTIKTKGYTTVCDKNPKACGSEVVLRPHIPKAPPTKPGTSKITTRVCPNGAVVTDSQRCPVVKPRFPTFPGKRMFKSSKRSGTIKTKGYTTICDKNPKACGGDIVLKPRKPKTPPVKTSNRTTRVCPGGTVVTDSQRCPVIKLRSPFSTRMSMNRFR